VEADSVSKQKDIAVGRRRRNRNRSCCLREEESGWGRDRERDRVEGWREGRRRIGSFGRSIDVLGLGGARNRRNIDGWVEVGKVGHYFGVERGCRLQLLRRRSCCLQSRDRPGKEVRDCPCRVVEQLHILGRLALTGHHNLSRFGYTRFDFAHMDPQLHP
jgi:hypothetical protein